MAERQPKVSIIGDASRLVSAFHKAASATDKFTRNAKTSSSHLNRLSTAATVAGAAVLGMAVVGLKKSASAAMEAEASNARLAAQLKTVGKNTTVVRGQIEQTVQSLSRMSGFDDEQLQDAFTLLVRTTGNVTKSQQELGLVADIARGRQISLAQAAGIVNRVNVGNVGSLKRLGIEVDKNTTKQQAFAMLQQKFSGQAAAYGQTAAGAQERLGVAMENAFEAVGVALTPLIIAFSNWASDVLPRAVNWLMQNKTAVLAVTGVLGGLWAALAGARMVNTFAEAFKVLNAVMKGNIFLLIAGAIVAVGTALYLAYQKSEPFRRAVDRLLEAVKPVAEFLLNVAIIAFRGLAEIIKVGMIAFHGITTAIGAVWDALRKIGSWIKSAAMAVFGVLRDAVNVALAPFLAIKDAIQWIIDHLPSISKANVKGPVNLRNAGGNTGGMTGNTKSSKENDRWVTTLSDRLGKAFTQIRDQMASAAAGLSGMLGQLRRSQYAASKSFSYAGDSLFSEKGAGRTGFKGDASLNEKMQALADRQALRQEKSLLDNIARLNKDADASQDERDAAQDDLKDFYAQRDIDRMQAAVEAQAESDEKAVNSLAARFRNGEINAAEFQSTLEKLVGGDTGAAAGAMFGAEWTSAFQAVLEPLKTEIWKKLGLSNVIGPGTNDSGPMLSSAADDDWLEARKKFIKDLNARKKGKKGYTDEEKAFMRKTYGADNIGDWTKLNPRPLAIGGIATGPTFAMIGESGAEAVIPLEGPRARRMLRGANGIGSGQVTMVFNGVLNAKDAARMLRPELDRLVRLAV